MRSNRLIIILLIVAVVLVAAIGAILLLGGSPEQGKAPEGTPLVTPALWATATPTPLPDPGGADTPEGAVKRYFAYWNAKDRAGMNSCLIESDRILYDSLEEDPYELDMLGSVTLTSVSQSGAEAGEAFGEDIYANPAGTALVLVSYTLTYNDAGKEYYRTADPVTHEDFRFWLVKETEGGEWRIAQKGY